MDNTWEKSIEQEVSDWKRMSFQTGFYSIILTLMLIFIIVINPESDLLGKVRIIIIFILVIALDVIVLTLFFISASFYRAVKYLKDVESTD